MHLTEDEKALRVGKALLEAFEEWSQTNGKK
jgi:hypothetical protein